MTSADPAASLANPTALNDLVLYRLARLSATAGTMVIRLCEGRFGITRREWRMVALLAESDALHPSALAERAQLDRARTSRAVSSLVAKGLVLRTVQASDQRYAQLCLSEHGRRLHEALFPLVADINRQLIEGLDGRARQALATSLGHLQDRAQLLLDRAAVPSHGRGRQRRSQ